MNVQTSANSLIAGSRVSGTEVYNLVGEHLGRIEDIMIHKADGQVAYAIMGFGGLLGVGEKFHPVPWSLLRYDTTQGGYLVPLDKDTLFKAPAFARSELTEDDSTWREEIHSYYNVPPYWS